MELARANRHYLPGYVWHITHRCHKREFLLKFARDQRRWLLGPTQIRQIHSFFSHRWASGIWMMRNRITHFKQIAEEKLPSTPENDKIAKTFFEILKFIHKNNWEGACHATSAILYILLKEQGIDATLYIGECQQGSFVFDHSWVEVSSEVVDAAIYPWPCIEEWACLRY